VLTAFCFKTEPSIKNRLISPFELHHCTICGADIRNAIKTQAVRADAKQNKFQKAVPIASLAVQ
jgi:hypothetical protein